jgi:acyl carrier protein
MTDKVYEIVSRVFDIPVSQITDESGQEDVESWDSFNVYVLLDEIESTFNVKFNLEETLEIKKVKDFKKLLQKHGVT